MRSPEDLLTSEIRYRRLFESARDGILILDAVTRKITDVNPYMMELLDYTREEFLGKELWEIGLLKDEEESIAAFRELQKKDYIRYDDIPLKTKDGDIREVEVVSNVYEEADRQVIQCNIRDNTEHKLIEDRQAAILDALPAHICLLDQSGNILEVNNEWKQFALANGYDGIDFGVGSNYLETCENVTGDFAEGARQAADSCRAVLAGEAFHLEVEYPCHSPTEKRWFKLTVTALHKEKSVGAVVMHVNITERKQFEEQLLHDAFHDGLTGLANRTFFIEHLQVMIERARRDQSELFAVLFLDFDGFKVINDSLGHAEGDNLLKQIARRLKLSLRSGDLVARLGGDEFTVLVNKISDLSVALRVAEHIQKNLQTPFEIGGGEIFISASIGIALSTTGHNRAEDIVREADIAMYRAKAKGRAQFQVFDRAMHEQASARLRIETELRQAIEQKEFCLHYQPIFSLKTNRTVGFESLVRWKHAEFKMIPPNDFIPIAEENGSIIPLGQWILHESCRQMREWQISNPSASSLTISVNLSFKQFLQHNLAEQVATVLKETGLDPKCLKLEITESHVMENSEKAIVMMNCLRALDIELNLDDFGTGYSSLSCLHRLPVNYLKIDRSFVMRMTESEENGEIVSTIIKLAQNLKMKVVAEGIETAAQLVRLKSLNCEYGQGYFFAKPMEAETAEMFIDKSMENSAYLTDQSVFNADFNM